ncbi:hypothetical protein MPSEU_000857700 [Mayamaea pseudoterrestris]|nr:hypothetical protein MPSEU_000857700 [Mayamaea pseudoterrestris]
MTDTPSWLSTDEAVQDVTMNDAPTTGIVGTQSATAAAAPSPSRSAPMEVTGAETIEAADAELPRMILFMRLANLCAAGGMIACSILMMIGLPAVSGFVLAIYATCGALLICCLETQLKFLRVMIAVNFGFLFHSVWRFLFYLLLGSVAWSYDTLFGKIVAGCFIGCACFNTFILCRYPGYRKIREKIAEEEDKRIEARISKEVRRQATKSFMGGNST